MYVLGFFLLILSNCTVWLVLDGWIGIGVKVVNSIWIFLIIKYVFLFSLINSIKLCWLIGVGVRFCEFNLIFFFFCVFQGASSLTQSDSSKRSSASEPDGAEVVYLKDNVSIHPTQYASQRINGRLRLIKQGSSLFMVIICCCIWEM